MRSVEDPGKASESWLLGHWVLRMPSGPLLRDGEPVPLGGRALDLLAMLVRHRHDVVSAEALLAHAWAGRVVEEGNLYLHISTLRRLLGRDAIRSVYGRGYQLMLDVAPLAADPEPSKTGLPPTAAPAVALPPAPDGPMLFGRADDQAALLASLARHRLVTVAGPGGVGKTRLAMAVADDVGTRAVVELAGLAAPTLLVDAVARALGVQLPGLRPALDELADALQQPSALLVLDNCEHRVAEVAALVDGLLRRTRSLRVLATSQVPLAVRDEQVFRLQPLPLPASGMALDEARDNPAVALFVARVTAVDRHFTLTADTLADVVAVCLQLDGLPLAIELAAARVPLLGVAGLRERLGERLKLLRGGARGTDARHHTLQAAIEWSHALLDEREKQVFGELGVFAGGFTLQLAQQVLSGPADTDADADDDPLATLDAIEALLTRSLLVPVPSAPQPRHRLLDSTRTFALQRLHEAGTADRLQERLARALLKQFEPADTLHLAYSNPDRVAACVGDVDNLRAALDWLVGQPDHAELHVALAGASSWFWPRAGLRNEGLRRCREALARVSAATPPALEARLLWGVTAALHHRGEAADCAAAERAVALYRQAGDRAGVFLSLNVVITLRVVRGEQAEAEAAMEAMDAAFDPGWPTWSWGPRVWAIAMCLAHGDDIESALQVIRDARETAVQVNYAPGVANACRGEAQCLSALGRVAEAASCARTGLAAGLPRQSLAQRGGLLGDLSTYLAELGETAEALQLAREAVHLRARDGTLWLQLDQLALLASQCGRPVEAAQLLGRADAQNLWRNGGRELYLRRPHRLATQAVAAALSPVDLHEAMARGRAMSDWEAARLLLDLAEAQQAGVPLAA